MAVQYKVVTESAYDAWYRLTSPTSQIQAYVFDVIRSTVPRMELDQDLNLRMILPRLFMISFKM